MPQAVRLSPVASARPRRRWLRRLLWLPVLFVAITGLQVLVPRFVDPPTSAFMVWRQLDGLGEAGFELRYDWRDYDQISPSLPISLVAPGQTLNITSVTLGQKFQIGFLALPEAVPQVEKLAAYAVDAFAELQQAMPATRPRAAEPQADVARPARRKVVKAEPAPAPKAKARAATKSPPAAKARSARKPPSKATA